MPEQQQLIIADKPNGLERSQPTPMDLLHMAVERGVDISQLTALVALKERCEADEARKAYADAFVKMRPHLPVVIRTKENVQTHSKYAPLEVINEAVNPVLQAYGFATSTKIVDQDETSVTVAAELWHSGSHVERTQIKIPLDKTGIQGSVNKTAPHALLSSATYGRRAAICALLNISTGDDTDGNVDGQSVPADWLTEQLDWIANACKPDELKRLYQAAFKKAQAAGDKAAMGRIIAAKDAKKKEFEV